MNTEWFYTVGDERRGPVELAALKKLVTAGIVSSRDLVWHEGMPDWTAVSATSDLATDSGAKTQAPSFPVNKTAVPVARRPTASFQFEADKPAVPPMPPIPPAVPDLPRTQANFDGKVIRSTPNTAKQSGSVSRPASGTRPFIPKRRSSKRWILLVVGIAILGIVAVGIPEWKRSRMQANENSAYALLETYPAAQEIYRNVNYKEDGVPKYAQSLNELFSAKPDLVLIDKRFMEAEGPSETAVPYAGYLFKVLKAQGRCAQNGKRSYVVNGNMILGYALVAYPMVYDETGRDTYILNHDGTVFQKDLGPDTTATVDAMTDFNPDPTWTPSGPSLEIQRQDINLDEFLTPSANGVANRTKNQSGETDNVKKGVDLMARTDARVRELVIGHGDDPTTAIGVACRELGMGEVAANKLKARYLGVDSMPPGLSSEQARIDQELEARHSALLNKARKEIETLIQARGESPKSAVRSVSQQLGLSQNDRAILIGQYDALGIKQEKLIDLQRRTKSLTQELQGLQHELKTFLGCLESDRRLQTRMPGGRGLEEQINREEAEARKRTDDISAKQTELNNLSSEQDRLKAEINRAMNGENAATAPRENIPLRPSLAGSQDASESKSDETIRLQAEIKALDSTITESDRELQDTYTRAQNLRKQMYTANDSTKQSLDRQHADLVTKADQLKAKLEDLRKRKAEANVALEQAKNQ